jgi:3-deoxy-D-manno-octulosonic-acid transferase
LLALYNLLLPILAVLVRGAAVFDSKIRRGLRGRSGLSGQVRAYYSAAAISGPRILIHVASFGELEQAKPVISALRERYPEAHIHLTFFSPSGYENAAGKYREPDFITYSPFDRPAEVRAFLDAARPDIALFTRYDVWPNMAAGLAERAIPSILFAATAAPASRRALPLVRSLHRTVYNSLTKILAISEADRTRFEALGIDSGRIEVVGDTRFDQVVARKAASVQKHLLPEKMRSQLDARGTLVFVLGSAWPADEAIVEATVRRAIERSDNILWIIVPHEPDAEHIAKLLSAYPRKTIKLSHIDNWSGEPVVIVDSIGKLFGLYQYADIAMIGGGFSAGLHNALEAAVWDAAVIVGPRHQKSCEVQAMIDRLAAFEVKSAREFEFVFERLLSDDDLRSSTGAKARAFVEEGQGATARILDAISELMPTTQKSSSSSSPTMSVLT